MNIIKKYPLIIAGIVLGGAAGFLYWNYVGCLSGHCQITSLWYNSTLYGALMGGLLANLFTVDPKKQKENDGNN